MNIKEFARKIVWLGHDTFRIDSQQVIWFDPYEADDGPVADIILVSHDHFDHCSPADVARISGPETIIVTGASSAEKLSGNIRIISPGQSVNIGDIRITGVPAYNTDRQFHPKEKGWLGFIVEVDGIRIYHAGDTDFIPEMRELKADIALLPVSGTYVMDAGQAVAAARAIRPKIVIPMHYGTLVGSEADAVRFREAPEREMDVMILPKS